MSSPAASSPAPSAKLPHEVRARPWYRRRRWVVLMAALALACILALVLPLALILPNRGDGAPQANGPRVRLGSNNATYVASNAYGFDEWKGIRYAAPPVGNLRFAAPQPPPSPPTVATSGTTTSSKHMRNNRRSLSAPMLRRADAVAAADQELLLKAVYAGSPCPQPGQGKNDAEDCLFLSIIRPEGEPTTPLPVLIFVHGGGFQAGSGSQYIAGMRGFLNAGIQAGAPPAMVAVINYRLGAFGFMGGSMMESLANRTQPDAVLNAGTRDIKAATEWVRDNIADFGGDTSRITLWGQSAGAFSTGAQILGQAATGRNASDTSNSPFSAAILQSGNPGGVPCPPQRFKDPQFERILSAAKCPNSSPDAAVACLRALPWTELRHISIAESDRALQPESYILGSYPWTAGLDGGPENGGFFADEPSAVLQAGDFARVPLLLGDVEDEGTQFAPHNFEDTAALERWIRTIYFAEPEAGSSKLVMASLLASYPDDPKLGSPYNLNASDQDDRFFGTTNQYRRAASIYGDIRFQSNRRFFAQMAADRNVPVRSFVYAQRPPNEQLALGVPHGADLDALMSQRSPLGSIMAKQWMTFAATRNPNTDGVPRWPLYGNGNGTILRYENDTGSSVPDTFRYAAMNALNSQAVHIATSR